MELLISLFFPLFMPLVDVYAFLLFYLTVAFDVIKHGISLCLVQWNHRHLDVVFILLVFIQLLLMPMHFIQSYNKDGFRTKVAI